MSTTDPRYLAAAEAAGVIRLRTAVEPVVGLVLGSGLGVMADEIGPSPGGLPRVEIDYADIPGFPVSTVEGHAGRLVLGGLRGVAVVAMQGRFHYYEGYSMDEVTAPVRVMRLLGVRTLLVTNAAGGINEALTPGSLMVIRDHIKLFIDSPLRGPNIPEFGPRFNDMSYAYTPRLRALAAEVAAELDIRLAEGVYAHMGGPSYETPAEIRMLRTLGADAVGMSTVPEVLVAAHCGMEVVGISAISNLAAGILDQPLTHDEVMEAAGAVRERFIALVGGVVARLANL